MRHDIDQAMFEMEHPAHERSPFAGQGYEAGPFEFETPDPELESDEMELAAQLLEVTSEEWERIFAVNVRGSYNVTRRLAPGLVERGFGRIVFLSSVSAERGGGVFGGVGYSAAKAGQLGFARALARELGPVGVTVNSVAPGLIDTDITAGKLVGEKEKEVLAGVPVGRKGRPSDVADLITYLCREESGYITGVTYDVNGGAHIH